LGIKEKHDKGYHGILVVFFFCCACAMTNTNLRIGIVENLSVSLSFILSKNEKVKYDKDEYS